MIRYVRNAGLAYAKKKSTESGAVTRNRIENIIISKP